MSKQRTRKRNGRSGGNGINQKFLDSIVGTGVDDQLSQPVQNLLAKDFPLANIRREDREYFRLLSENIAHYVREQYPPQASLVQGDVGAALLEDPGYQMEALSHQQANEIETLLMAAFARTSRGEGGWQQDKLTENIQTKRVEDNRETGNDGGLIGGLFD